MCVVFMIVFMLAACSSVQPAGDVKIAVSTPSESELNIASGRQFKVSGTLEGEVQLVIMSTGVSRTKTAGEESDTCYDEFYNVFPSGMLKEGTSYDVSVQVHDRNGTPVVQRACRFTVSDK